MRIAVTGAAGFVGSAMVRLLSANGHDVVPIVRSPSGLAGEQVVGDLAGDAWGRVSLANVEAIVHAAARVHVTRESARDPLAAFRSVNALGTIALARHAAGCGVRRFVFLSTIGVNGEQTEPGRPFRPDAPLRPASSYAISKWEAELGLRDVAAATDLECVTVRPPLVYGAGARGRFATLMRAVERGWPLPLGAVRNRRQFVSIDNLADFLLVCLVEPRAAGGTYLVADAEAVSTRAFVEILASKLGKVPRLVPVSPALLMAAARLLGRRQAAVGLLGSLEIDLWKNFDRLGWRPPLTLDEGLERAAGVR